MPTGTPNTPVSIAGSDGIQTFLLSFQGTAPFSAPAMPLIFGCDNTPPAAIEPGVDTVDLVMSSTPIADIIALAATATNNGIAELPNGGVGAFAVASINIGVTAAITVSVDTGAAALPVTLSICQTDPSTGQCLAPPAASVSLSYAGNTAPTFSVFLQSSGAIAFAPASARVFVRFKDAGGRAARLDQRRDRDRLEQRFQSSARMLMWLAPSPNPLPRGGRGSSYSARPPSPSPLGRGPG